MDPAASSPAVEVNKCLVLLNQQLIGNGDMHSTLEFVHSSLENLGDSELKSELSALLQQFESCTSDTERYKLIAQMQAAIVKDILPSKYASLRQTLQQVLSPKVSPEELRKGMSKLQVEVVTLVHNTGKEEQANLNRQIQSLFASRVAGPAQEKEAVEELHSSINQIIYPDL